MIGADGSVRGTTVPVPVRTGILLMKQNGHLRRLAQVHATLTWPQYCILTGNGNAGTQDSTGLGAVPKLTILQGSTGKFEMQTQSGRGGGNGRPPVRMAGAGARACDPAAPGRPAADAQ